MCCIFRDTLIDFRQYKIFLQSKHFVYFITVPHYGHMSILSVEVKHCHLDFATVESIIWLN
jgi:hypothetical protein